MHVAPQSLDLIDRAVAALGVPRVGPANSFVLHAQLELMARIGLLPYLTADRDGAALGAIAALVARYEHAGEPTQTAVLDEADEPAAALVRSIAAGDLQQVDATICAVLAGVPTHRDVRRLLGEAVVDSLAAAGHAPIGLYLLGRVGGGQLPGNLLRGPLRELARHPDWRVRWFRSSDDRGDADLETTLRSLPFVGRPANDSILALMTQVEASGVAQTHLAASLPTSPDVKAMSRTLLRAAAWSMLHDDPDHAPYGWTHALTMPQAVLSLADGAVEPRTAAAVALTYLAGFRIAYGASALGDLSDAAASAYASEDVAELAAFGAAHHDAHVVKYTLACLHAADEDPPWRPVYLAAAAYLARWWRENPNAGFG